MANISREDLTSVVGNAMVVGSRGTGVSSSAFDAAAALSSSWIVQAELLGLPAFGIDMLVRELHRLATAAQEPGNDEDTALADPSILTVDASKLPGPLALAIATKRAAEIARTSGISMVGLHSVGALGMIGSAARELASEGLIGIVSANSPAIVAPIGGSAPAIGTNPIAIAAPRADLPPLIIDFATSPTTVAALRNATSAGTELQGPGGFDSEGQPTRDPSKTVALAPEGRISSLAGLLVEILAGVGIGARSTPVAIPGTRSAFVLALSPAVFGADDAAEACARLAEMWGNAGGHVPGRFDTLTAREHGDSLLQVNAASVEELRNQARNAQ